MMRFFSRLAMPRPTQRNCAYGCRYPASSLTKPACRIPKLRHGLPRSVYIKDSQGVAETNPKATIAAQQSSLAGALKPLEMAHKLKKVVCVFLASEDVAV